MCVPDNYSRYEWHEEEQERCLATLPLCSICKNHIQQEKAVYYNDQWCCEDCESEFFECIREDFLEVVGI